MTTKKAFQHLTSQRAWYKLCGINKDTARSLKRHSKNDGVSDEKMGSLLKSAGYKHTPSKWTCA